MPFNKYYTNTNILVNYLSDIEMQDLGFIDFQNFWEFSKHFFSLEMDYFVRIYKKTFSELFKVAMSAKAA